LLRDRVRHDRWQQHLRLHQLPSIPCRIGICSPLHERQLTINLPHRLVHVVGDRLVHVVGVFGVGTEAYESEKEHAYTQRDNGEARVNEKIEGRVKEEIETISRRDMLFYSCH
jgi:hypothetical protein